MGSLPFSGVRITDFSHEWAGPIATRILGDFGAEVIRVEYARRMCVLRGARKENRMYNRHPKWHQVNRNKLSVTLDLNVRGDLEAFQDLIRISDVVVSNSRPAVLEKFGLTYPELQKIRPDIILASLPAFGATGPYSAFAGFGGTIEPLSGLQALTAYDKSGKRFRLREMDVCNGLMAACAIFTALLHRQRTGQGQWIDLSQFETATHALLGEHLLGYVMNGTQTLPLGNRNRYYAPQGCYRCKGDDKWIAITIRSDEEWERFCEALGNPELKEDPRFRTRSARAQHHDELDHLIEAWTSASDHYEAVHCLQKAGVPAGAVLNAADLCTDPHLNSRGYFMAAEDGSIGLFAGMLLKLSEGGGQLRRRGPDLGQDNEEVLCRLLEYPRGRVRPLCEEEIGTGYEPE